MKIKWWTGTETIEVEVTVEQATALQEMKREEWRSNKQIERHESAISLTQMEEDGENGKVNDLVKKQRRDAAFLEDDFVEDLIAIEERIELLAKLHSAFLMLSTEQKEFISLKYRKNMKNGEIAKVLCISRQAVDCRETSTIKKLRTFFEK